MTRTTFLRTKCPRPSSGRILDGTFHAIQNIPPHLFPLIVHLLLLTCILQLHSPFLTQCFHQHIKYPCQEQRHQTWAPWHTRPILIANHRCRRATVMNPPSTSAIIIMLLISFPSPESSLSYPVRAESSRSLNASEGSFHSSPQSPESISEISLSPGPSSPVETVPSNAPSAAAHANKQKRAKPPKMHQCDICVKQFPRPSGLQTHMNIHNNAKRAFLRSPRSSF
ncbi:hypothetical protein B0H10DRAFT_319705 [Mycena sp. CBHHK59/15]|nr:hypothetical protein B0H10DRAFT_319705 [Mycena sp. CBHHK59/15]